MVHPLEHSGCGFWQKNRALWRRNLFRRGKAWYTERNEPERIKER